MGAAMTATTKLDATVAVELGAFSLDVALQADAGDTVALVGPNGSGKTTLLRALAGLQPVDEASIVVDGVAVHDLPAEERPFGLVFQDRLLLPHLDAVENVAFGLRRAGMGKRAARAEAMAWLERVGLAHKAALQPHALSGGMAQRVALVRALALRPAVLLLDEPFGAVDLAARAVVREVLRAPEGGAGSRVDVLVTHQPVEVLALADRVVVLEAGRVVQTGSVDDVRSRPRSEWAAEMAGVNLLQGTAVAGGLEVGDVTIAVAGAVGLVGPTFAVVHPHAVTLSRDEPNTSARNAWRGEVAAVDLERDRARVRVLGPVELVAEVTVAAVADLGLVPGAPVWASVKATEIDLFPA
jgi:molybdate transport system ATP-binding protein